jgi:hypothetical protein
MVVWNIRSCATANCRQLCTFMAANQISVAAITEASDVAMLGSEAQSAFGAGNYFLESCKEEPEPFAFKPNLMLDTDVSGFHNSGNYLLQPATKIGLVDGSHVNNVEYQNLGATQQDKPLGKKYAVLAVRAGTMVGGQASAGPASISTITLTAYHSQKVVVEYIMDKKKSGIIGAKKSFALGQGPPRSFKYYVIKGRLDELSLRRPGHCQLDFGGSVVDLYDFHAGEGGGQHGKQYSGRFSVSSNQIWRTANDNTMPDRAILAGDLNLGTTGVQTYLVRNFHAAAAIHASHDKWTAVVYRVPSFTVVEVGLDLSGFNSLSDHMPMVVDVTY